MPNLRRFFRSKKLLILLVFVLILFILSLEKIPKKITYGVSFSRFHADELGLDWKETYLAILNDLNVKNFRFSAHWPLTEPEDDKFNFSELDFQMDQARDKNASVILAVGRRLPGWPECHEPEWLKNKISKIKDQNEKSQFLNDQLLKYIEAVVNRYKNYDNLVYWQIENEPFLTFFSRSACGEPDKGLLDKEIDLVKKLDPNRKVVITDSGEFGTWLGAYRRGDVFGTSLYLYVWNRRLGPLRYPITPAFFRIKKNLTELVAGDKYSFIIELSTEPWLLQPILKTPLDVQFDRMGADKFEEMAEFSAKTGFDRIYFWGAEWWYWLKLKDYDQHWLKAKELLAD